MTKKAQGISINVIIIAAIALLVLVILSVIFIGKLGIFGVKVNECENKGGLCVPTDVNCGADEIVKAKNVADYPTEMPDWTCPKVDEEEQRCCIKVTA